MYSTGAGFVEAFLNYPSWKIIGPSPQWQAYRAMLGPHIIPLLAIPSLPVSLILNLSLFFWRPAGVARWTVWACLAFLLIALVSTAAIQIPIQIQLDQRYDPALVDRLMVTSFWFRDVMSVLRIVVLCIMMTNALSVDRNSISPSVPQ